MNSIGSPNFWKCYRNLPKSVREDARKAYRKWLIDPYDSTLRFKEIEKRGSEPLYSVRINYDYRALGNKVDDAIVWFWIGTHAGYDHRT